MDTAHSSKTISATHSLLPNSVNSAFLQRSMCVGFLFFFFSCCWFYFCFVLFLSFARQEDVRTKGSRPETGENEISKIYNSAPKVKSKATASYGANNNVIT